MKADKTLGIQKVRASDDPKTAHIFGSDALRKALEILMGLYSDMSLEDLTTLKNWLLAKIEATDAEKKVNAAAIVKQFKEQLKEVEAGIASKEKPV